MDDRYEVRITRHAVKLYRNAVDESRKIKPQIPLTGADGIPIRHEIELEMNTAVFQIQELSLGQIRRLYSERLKRTFRLMR